MNKNKKALKGFTLIELIIVLAIFSVIMVLAMSFIDPVSRTMTDTSVRERTAAYVDNIGEYVDKSIRYSQFIRISENNYYNGSDVVSEEEALVDFIDDFYDGAIKEDFTPVTGKVHVLKLVNTDTGGYQAGRVYESVYNFVAGDSIDYDTGAGTGKDIEKRWDDELSIYVNTSVGDFVNGSYINEGEAAIGVPLSFPHSKVTPVTTDNQVINEEHYQEYSYYYQLGLYEYLPVNDAVLGDYGLTADENAKFYYNQLVKRLNGSVEIQPSERQFSLNVVSYQVKNGVSNKFDVVYSPEGSDDAENTVLFRSPSNMNTISMTFQNVITSKVADSNSKLASYYRIRQNTYKAAPGSINDNAGKGEVVDDVVKLDPVTYTDMPFSYKAAAEGENVDIIYMIYTLPDEIYDSDIVESSSDDDEEEAPPMAVV